MGAYLSSPVCDQETSEESNEQLAFVASSMQGWRISQEDAHNAILNYDDQTSFFAVYDGHGGAEIARYCAEALPDFIRQLRPYKEGNLREALIEGFIQFDARLNEPKVKKILQKFVAEQDEEDEENDEAVEENLVNPNPKENSILQQHDELDHHEETKLLHEEAQLPIEHLLQRFTSTDNDHPQSKSIEEIPVGKETTSGNDDDDDEQKDQPSSSEPTTRTRRIRKPVTTSTTTTTTVETTSLLGQLISGDAAAMGDEDEEDDEDEDFDCEQSDDGDGEEEEEEEEEEDGEEEGEEAEIKRIMKKSILSVLSGEKDEDEEDEEDEDLEMADVENDPGSSSGCTAVVVILQGNELVVANAGDSRCVLCRQGNAVEMSVDHKPEDGGERQRIEKAGYKVTSDGRVSGGLNLSRAIGDHAYKRKSGLSPCEQAITPLPDVRQLTLDERDEFLVVACDGIWNSMSSEQVVQFVRSRLEQKKNLRDICDELFLQCLAPNTCGDGTGCDNMTAIIVQFVRPARAKESRLSPKSPLSSSLSINHKRSLSPSPQNKKKRKVLQENDDEHERHSSLSSPMK